MSSTRRSTDNSRYHQSKFASSPAFERGLTAFQVAKHCGLIADEADRELIYFIQYLSFQPGSLARVAADLIEKFRHCMGPVAALQYGKKPADIFTAEQVRQIRAQMPQHLRSRFSLRGEIDRSQKSAIWANKNAADRAKIEIQGCDLSSKEIDDLQRLIEKGKSAEIELDAAMADSEQLPEAYLVDSVLECCAECAGRGGQLGDKSNSLVRELADFCNNPDYDMMAGPWYFSNLVSCLHEYHRQWKHEKSLGYVTKIGQRVYQNLDQTLEMGGLSLLMATPNVGVKFAARAWCAQHPGKARLVEVPATNDDASFYREVASAIGIGNFETYKNTQIRERIEYVLQQGHILLVLNSAQNLWPVKNLREASAGRLAWLEGQCKKGARACMIAGPQFFLQARPCEKTALNAQAMMTIADHFDVLPDALDFDDLKNVASIMLPEASECDWETVAITAIADGQLAMIERVASKALYIAKLAGRSQRNNVDIKQAMQQVSQSAALLRQAIDSHNGKPAKKNPLASPSVGGPITAPVKQPRFQRRHEETEFLPS